MHLWDKLEGYLGSHIRSLGNGIIEFGGERVLGMPPYLLDGRCPYEVALSVMDAAGVDAAVVTQDYLDGNQNAYLAQVRKHCPERFFVQGLLEFRQPDQLSGEFRRVSQEYGFQGIKLPAQALAQATPRVCLTDRRVMDVIEQMAERRMILSVDLDYGESQVDEMRAVARAFPQLTITLGHFAMVGRKDWLKQLALAEEPNVYVESGGITWLLRHEGPPFPGAQEAVRQAVARVGADKLMWGSDFPRTQVDFTYEQTLDFLVKGCRFLSDAQRAAILGGTAVKVFGFQRPTKARQRPKRITEFD
jgi:predicted TIM-barrel fold metal-dependent hydrolase